MKLVGTFFSFFRYNIPIAFLTCTIFYFFFISEKAYDVVKGSKNVSVSLTKHIQHGNNIFLTSAIIHELGSHSIKWHEWYNLAPSLCFNFEVCPMLGSKSKL